MASLKAVYEKFLASPDAAALADNASLCYITTLTTIHSAAAIAKHWSRTDKELKKTEEKLLSVIESGDSICSEIETTLKFLSGGGAYLPGLENNFLSGRVVTFPIVHIVHFNTNRKIQQIRLLWDQGSLLKLVDVIGARARSWPISDGREQIRLISSMTTAASGAMSSAESIQSSSTRASREPEKVVITGRNPSPQKKFIGDPHASLSLFDPRDTNTEPTQSHPGVATRVSAKPPPRDYHDLFVGNDSDNSPASKTKATSPKKENSTPAIASKGGAGKNFQPSRLFDTDNAQPGTPGASSQSSEKHRKTNPQKYDHFTFGDGSDEPLKQPSALPARFNMHHQSQWDFEDFVTPEKPQQKIRGQDVRHFSWGDDEPAIDNPGQKPKVANPRRDAQTHFEFKDDGTPAANRRPAGNTRGQAANKALGLYQNNVYSDEGSFGTSPEKKASRPLSTVTNVNERRKDFDPHFSMTDEVPTPATKTNDENKPIGEARNKAVKMMDANWSSYDQSPDTQVQKSSKHAQGPSQNGHGVQKENSISGESRKPIETGIKTSGDGMGGKKGTGRSWGFGDDSDEDGVGGINGGKFRAAKVQQAPKDNSFWDF